MRRRQSGFGAIAAIVVLVICALLAAAITHLSATAQVASAQDLLSARAWQAARAGNEWGLFRALQQPRAEYPCAGASDTLSIGNGFVVTVTCTALSYNEGESTPGTAATTTVYQIVAIACNAAACPAAAATAATPGYIERRRMVLATDN